MAGADESTKRPQIVQQPTVIHDNDGTTQYLDFDEQVVEGKPGRPDILYLEKTPQATLGKEGSITTSLDNLYAADTDKDGTHQLQGWGQVIWDTLVKLNSDPGQAFTSSDNVYANNFVINYHSFTSPIPFPLEHYVTSCSFTKTKTGAYETADMTLKIPYQLALSIFAEDDSQPQPGGYILVKTRPPTDPGQVLYAKTAPEIIENALHFGVVTSLTYEIAPDEAGNLMCEISLGSASFIHNLIYGEYRFSFLNSSDEVVRDNGDGTYVREVRQDGYSSRQYYQNIDDFLAFIKREVAAATGEYDLGQSLRRFVQQFAYPMLPISLHAEPMNAEFAYKILFETQATLEETVQHLRLYLPEGVINGLLYSLANLAQLAGDEQVGFGGDPFTQFYDPSNPLRNSFSRFIQNGFMNADAGPELPVTADDVVFEAERLRNAAKEKFKYDIQLKDIIHVAVKRDDLPPSSTLYGSMPETVEAFQDLNRIRNLGAKQLTVWGLLQGTFQIDNQLIEFYPTMIPILDSDVRYFKENSSIPNPIKRIHRKLGGIPTIILRLKPMHAKASVDASSIDKEYERKHLFGSPAALPPPCYVTSSEIIGLNTKDNSFGKSFRQLRAGLTQFDQDFSQEQIDESGNRTGPAQYTRRFAVGSQTADGAIQPSVSPDDRPKLIQPPNISKEQIISLRFRQSDADRVNATFVNLPGVKNLSSKVKYGIMSDPVINNTAALKHGLRMYETTYPYFELSVFQGQDASRAENLDKFFQMQGDNFQDMTRFKTTALAERAYMIYGDDQKFFNGEIVCTSLVTQNIYPGTWLEVFLKDLTGNKSVDQHAVLHVYVDTVSHSYNTDFFDGNVQVRSTIGFSRGSYGAIIPNFPTERVALPSFRSAAITTTQQRGRAVSPTIASALGVDGSASGTEEGSRIVDAILNSSQHASPRRVKNPLEPDLPAGRSAPGQSTSTIKTVKLTQEFIKSLTRNGVITHLEGIVLSSQDKVPQDNYEQLKELLDLAEGIEFDDDADSGDYDFSDEYDAHEARRANTSSVQAANVANSGSATAPQIAAEEARRRAREESSSAVPSGVTEETDQVRETTTREPVNEDGQIPIDADSEATKHRHEEATTQEAEYVDEVAIQYQQIIAAFEARQAAGTDFDAEGDTDGDGLLDTEEALIGTDPNLVNTDRDLNDDLEEVEYRAQGYTGVSPIEYTDYDITDANGLPLALDPDKDGLGAQFEAAVGSDPAKYDTDGDGISDYEEYGISDPTDPNSTITNREDYELPSGAPSRQDMLDWKDQNDVNPNNDE